MDKEQIRTLEGLLSGATSILYLVQKSDPEEAVEYLKEACGAVSDIIDRVRTALIKEYVDVTKKEKSCVGSVRMV